MKKRSLGFYLACISVMLLAAVALADLPNAFDGFAQSDTTSLRWMTYGVSGDKSYVLSGDTVATKVSFDFLIQSQDQTPAAGVVGYKQGALFDTLWEATAAGGPNFAEWLAANGPKSLDMMVVLTMGTSAKVRFDFHSPVESSVDVVLRDPATNEVIARDTLTTKAAGGQLVDKTKFDRILTAPTAFGAAKQYDLEVYSADVLRHKTPLFVVKVKDAEIDANIDYRVGEINHANQNEALLPMMPEQGHNHYTNFSGARNVDMGVVRQEWNPATRTFVSPTWQIVWTNYARVPLTLSSLQESTLAGDGPNYPNLTTQFIARDGAPMREDVAIYAGGGFSLNQRGWKGYLPTGYKHTFALATGTGTSRTLHWQGEESGKFTTYSWVLAANNTTNIVENLVGLSNVAVHHAPFAPNVKYFGSNTPEAIPAAKITTNCFSTGGVTGDKVMEPFQFSISADAVPAANKMIYAPFYVKFSLHRDEVIAKYGITTWTDLWTLAGNARTQANAKAIFDRLGPTKLLNGTKVNLSTLDVAKDALPRYFDVYQDNTVPSDPAIDVAFLINVVDGPACCGNANVIATDGYFLVFDGTKDGKIADPMCIDEPTVEPTTGPTSVPVTPPTSAPVSPTSGGSSSGGGCSAFGFAPMALLLLAPLALLRKRG